MVVRTVRADRDTDPDIADIAALEPSDGSMLYWASGGTRYNTTSSAAFGRSLLNGASASAIRTLLELGTASTVTLGTGVATALAVNVGSAGAPVVNGGALGTPSSGVLDACEVTATSETIAWPLSERFAMMVNVLGHIPKSLHASIRNGSNTTDLTTYCAAALTAAEAAGKALYYPSGTYVRDVNNIGSDDVVICGDGGQLSIIKQKDATNNYSFLVNGYDRVTIRDLGFDGNKANQTTVGSGVRVEGASDDFTLENCRFTNWYQFGCGLAGTGVRPTIRNNYFATCGLSGFIAVGFTDGKVSGNTSVGNTLDGIAITGSSHRWSVESNLCKTNGSMGIDVNQSNDVVTSGNICWNNTEHGIHHNTALRCSTATNNCQYNGISGVDFFASPDGCSTNDYVDFNTVRGIEIDSASHRTKAIGLRTNGNNGDVDISAFRSEDVEIIGCNGDVRIWDAGVLNTTGHTIAAAGSGYTDGTHTVTISGGTFGTAGQLSVTVSGGVVTAINSVVDDGDYWTLPSNPVSVTGLPGGGSGATFNLDWSGDSSDTCARAQVIGGGQGASNALVVVSGSASDVQLLGWAGTVADTGTHITSAQSCAQFRKPSTALSLQNSWVARGAGFNTPGFVVDGEGFCSLVGQMTSGTVAGNTLIATLPAGARPPETVYLLVMVSGSIGGIYIGSDGTIRDLGGTLSATWSSLDGLRFKVA